MEISLPDHHAVSDIIRRIAAEEILTRFRKLKDHEIGGKDSGEIVTAADIRGEERLTEELTALLPGSVVIGEESFASDPAIIDRFDQSAPIWVLDPLDGTRNFANGKECFCVIVALCHQGQTLVGWIYDPVNKEMTVGLRWRGVTIDGIKVEIAKPPELRGMTGSLGPRRKKMLVQNYSRDGSPLPAEIVRYRCIGREYVDLVKGKIHFAEYGNLKPWDHAAGVMIHNEAGGYSAYTSIDGLYSPGPAVSERFLVAPNDERWRELNRYLED